jgi:hypothetical protein
MRQALSHWFRIPRPDEAALWKTGLVGFDASVLLNIYAYSNETRSELVSLIEKNAARLRLPYQFGLEFARNRGAVIIKQVNNYRKAEKELEDFQQNQVESRRDHPYLSEESTKALVSIREELKKRRSEMEKLVAIDPYADKILAVFDGKLGPAPSSGELEKAHETAKERYEKNLPPGYTDLKDKAVPEAYGDCIGWLQLIEIAKKENKGFLLITDDLKEDWWHIERERTIGPRPELLAEFAALTGQKLWIYSSVNFLRAAKDFMGAEIGDQAIKEISDRIASQREMLRNLKIDPSVEGLLRARINEVAKALEKPSVPTASTEKATYPEQEKQEPPNEPEKVR